MRYTLRLLTIQQFQRAAALRHLDVCGQRVGGFCGGREVGLDAVPFTSQSPSWRRARPRRTTSDWPGSAGIGPSSPSCNSSRIGFATHELGGRRASRALVLANQDPGPNFRAALRGARRRPAARGRPCHRLGPRAQRRASPTVGVLQRRRAAQNANRPSATARWGMVSSTSTKCPAGEARFRPTLDANVLIKRARETGSTTGGANGLPCPSLEGQSPRTGVEVRQLRRGRCVSRPRRVFDGAGA
jgi:hypothetical protein